MGQHNLSRMLNPGQVAVVGASDKVGTIGNVLLKNLVDHGFPGTILPVNPKYQDIDGLKTYSSVSDLAPGVDLAVIATPINTVPDIIKECVERQIGGAIVLSAGGKEIGEQGIAVEEKIRAAVQSSGFRVIGPNCLGILQPGGKLNATFVTGMPQVGKLAFVSQSGAICSSILDLAFKNRIGFSHFVSIGSMVDVDFGDMIDYLGNDSSVGSIILYIENLTNFRKFMSAARSASRVKPIIVLKSGRSAAGAKAAASHTGAMVGEDAVYDAAFKRAGLLRVETIEELFDCAALLSGQRRYQGSRLAIITNGGGPGVMAADFLARHGYEPAPLDAQTLAALDAILPTYWSRNNPIDILGDASAERFRQVLDVCMHSASIDCILVIFVPQAMTDPMTVATSLAASLKGRPHPVFACWMGGQSVEQAVDFLHTSAIPTFDTPERAIRAFLNMAAFAKNQKLLLEVPPKVDRNLIFDHTKANNILTGSRRQGLLAEAEVRALLAAYSMPIVESVVATNKEQAARLSWKIGYPVVVKLLSTDISHKTDAGGVHVGLRSDSDVEKAYQEIMESAARYKPGARIEGVTVQPCIENADYEILLGAKRDPDFGPVILFGMGGIFTEVLGDKALGLPPMNRLLARRLMQETKVYTLLQGYRNHPPAHFEKLEELIIALSQLLIDFPQISELDMNPILIKDGLPIIVDVRLLVSPTAVVSPNHLVISSYPGDSISRMVTEGGIHILVRAVKPEDAPLFSQLFTVLSPTSIYHRFFGVVKELQPAVLSRFTQIDYDREIALVAIDEDAEQKRMLGVARIIGDPDGLEGEFAVLVGDPWQGKGIGSGLLRRCLLLAEKHGFKHIHGIVLRENTHMLALAKKMGFTGRASEDAGEYKIGIALDRLEIIEGLVSAGKKSK